MLLGYERFVCRFDVYDNSFYDILYGTYRRQFFALTNKRIAISTEIIKYSIFPFVCRMNLVIRIENVTPLGIIPCAAKIT